MYASLVDMLSIVTLSTLLPKIFGLCGSFKPKSGNLWFSAWEKSGSHDFLKILKIWTTLVRHGSFYDGWSISDHPYDVRRGRFDFNESVVNAMPGDSWLAKSEDIWQRSCAGHTCKRSGYKINGCRICCFLQSSFRGYGVWVCTQISPNRRVKRTGPTCVLTN